jgi:phage FluMu gp28-like protein
MPTDQQAEILAPKIKHVVRASLDYTGPGIGLGDYMVRDLGEFDPGQHRYGKIERCTFTNPFVREIMSKMKLTLEAKRIRLPVSRAVREDLHSLRRVVSAAGNITYRAPHTADGHADRANALALAIRAATEHVNSGYSAALV